jgi:hypothetical protein
MRNIRRDSPVNRIEEDQIQLAASGQKRYTVNSNKHLYIKWKTLTLDAFLNFLDDIDLFQKTVMHIQYPHRKRHPTGDKGLINNAQMSTF